MNTHATARYIRMSPTKVRQVVDLIRHKDVQEARRILTFSQRAAGRPVLKVLESAIANAENNFNLDPEELMVTKAYVDAGPTLRRWRPRARGRITRVRKRTSHITIAVGVPAVPARRTPPAASKRAPAKKGR